MSAAHGVPNSNLEKLSKLDVDELRGLRIKQLQSLCEYMQIVMPDVDGEMKRLKERGIFSKKEIEAAGKDLLVEQIDNRRKQVEEALSRRQSSAGGLRQSQARD
jgi:hypothetical protein